MHVIPNGSGVHKALISVTPLFPWGGARRQRAQQEQGMKDMQPTSPLPAQTLATLHNYLGGLLYSQD